MTRKEAIENIKLIRFNAALTNANSFREALDVAIEALSQPFIPSNLDKAAEDSWAVYEYRESPKGLYSTCYVDGFKAGAEWMAGQGETLNSLIWRDEDDKLFIDAFVDENKFKMAENVTIQVRKKK